MHEHIKPESCKHEFKYCEVCDVVYCEKCKMEWRNTPITTWTYNMPCTTPYEQYYTWNPLYGGATGGGGWQTIHGHEFHATTGPDTSG